VRFLLLGLRANIQTCKVCAREQIPWAERLLRNACETVEAIFRRSIEDPDHARGILYVQLFDHPKFLTYVGGQGQIRADMREP
jgi:hypothetical protein